MQKLILLAVLTCTQLALYAQTKFSGIINTDTTWTKANSPYIIDGDLLIEHGNTLTIEPGVVVEFDITYRFYCEGNIMAVGTPTDSISFIWKDWGGIRFRNDNRPDTATFSYCIFKGAREAAIEAYEGIFSITHSSFINNSGAMRLWGGNSKVVKSRFVDNACGIRIQDAVCEISQNEFVYTSTCILVDHKGKFNAHENIIWNAEQGVLSYGDSAEAEITDNQFLGSWCGIYAYSPAAPLTLITPLKGNIFAYNDYGLMLKQQFVGTIEMNSIKNNRYGIVIDEWLSTTTFENNCVDSNVHYNVQNNSTENLTMPNNWWGTTDSLMLQQRQYDYYDNVKRGKVSFMPLLTQSNAACKYVPPPPTVVTDVTLSDEMVTVYPNPFYNKVTIDLHSAKVKEVSIYDLMGKKIFTVEPKQKQVTIDLAAYPAGLYIYQGVYKDNTRFSGKLTKQ